MLKDIKSLKILTKKEQKLINGGSLFDLVDNCAIYAGMTAAIKADGEYFHTGFFEIHYQIAYDNCVNGTFEE